MYKGARSAYDFSPRILKLKDLVEVESFDDGGDEASARYISEKIMSDPSFVAVIGHGTSQTTIAAIENYYLVNLPILMPIATSPNTSAFHRKALRLPPNDILGQAPAIKILFEGKYLPEASAKSNRPRLALIKDLSTGTPDYTTPLVKQIDSDLGDFIVYKPDYRANDSGTTIARDIRAQNISLVIFCGYGTQAQNLLSSMRDVYLDVKNEDRPEILLTDGSHIPDLNASGFKTKVMFPVPKIFDKADDLIPITDPLKIRTDRDALRSSVLIDGKLQESYQMFGYDAMLLVGEAILQCSDVKISRQCVLGKLKETRSFQGVNEHYSFFEGENRKFDYYVYDVICENRNPPSPSTNTVSENRESLRIDQSIANCSAQYLFERKILINHSEK